MFHARNLYAALRGRIRYARWPLALLLGVSLSQPLQLQAAALEKGEMSLAPATRHGHSGPSSSEATKRLAALEERLVGHPALQAERWRATAFYETAVANLALPDPQLGLGINNFPFEDPSFSRFLPTNKSLSLRQRLPSRSGREALSRETQARALRSEALLEGLREQLSGELQSLWHERATRLAQYQLALRRMEKYRDLQAAIEATIESGEGTVYRLAQIAVESAAVETELAQRSGQLAQVDARLEQLVGVVPDGYPPPIELRSWNGEASRLHAVRIAKLEQQMAGHGVERAEAAWRPEWAAELTYQQRESGVSDSGAAFSGDDWLSARVSLTVPIWAASSQSPALRAAQARELAAEFAVADALRSASTAYEVLAAQHRAARQTEAALQSQLTAIDEQLALQLSAYQSGDGSFAGLVDAEIARLRLEAELLEAVNNAYRAVAFMNALQVTT